jgi:DnaK suppressor protein
MNQVTNINDSEMLKRKKALEAKLREVLGASVAREDLQIEYLADPLDQIKSNTDREMALHNLDQKSRLVQDIKLALGAIEEGTYGVCANCEDPIPRRRLDAVPWARLCVPCQQEAEASSSEAEPVFTHAA